MSHSDAQPVSDALRAALTTLPGETDALDIVAGIGAFVAQISRAMCRTEQLDEILCVVIMVANAALEGARAVHDAVDAEQVSRVVH